MAEAVLAAHVSGGVAVVLFRGLWDDGIDWDGFLIIASGDLRFIREWLRTHIHQYGRAYDANALARRITKKNLTAAPYCHYLRKKYSAIYNLK